MDEIEVTPEMIEAGFKVLAASGIADDFLGADRLMVAEIFRSMWPLSPDRKKTEQIEAK